MISREPIFRIHCKLASILDLGSTPFGHRRVVNILGGTITGERLAGRILPGGADWQIIAADGSADIHVRYRAPARIDEVIETRTRLTALRGAGFTLRQRILRGEQLLTEAEVRAVCIDLKGRPRRLPPALQAALSACAVNEKDA